MTFFRKSMLEGDMTIFLAPDKCAALTGQLD